MIISKIGTAQLSAHFAFRPPFKSVTFLGLTPSTESDQFSAGPFTFPTMATIDTTHVPSGSHSFRACATLHSVRTPQSHIKVKFQPVSANIFNPIAFHDVVNNLGEVVQDGWDGVFGERAQIRAVVTQKGVGGVIVPQSVNYIVKLYKSGMNSPVRTFTGTSSDGLITVDWDLKDDLGNDLVDESFDCSIQTSPSGGGAEAGSEGSQSRKGMKKEPMANWPEGGGWIVAVQPSVGCFDNLSENMGKLRAIYSFADWLDQEAINNNSNCDFNYNDYPYLVFPPRPWYQAYWVDAVYDGPATKSDEQHIATQWNEIRGAISNFKVRNMFLAAHGSIWEVGGSSIQKGEHGIYETRDKEDCCLTSGWVKDNSHKPWRFVFLDGCSTSRDGTWARAFGITSLFGKDIKNLDFYRNEGLRPRAFVGYNIDVPIGQGISGLVGPNSDINPDGRWFIEQFFKRWYGKSDYTGHYDRESLSDAIHHANQDLKSNPDIVDDILRTGGGCETGKISCRLEATKIWVFSKQTVKTLCAKKDGSNEWNHEYCRSDKSICKLGFDCNSSLCFRFCRSVAFTHDDASGGQPSALF